MVDSFMELPISVNILKNFGVRSFWIDFARFGPRAAI